MRSHLPMTHGASISQHGIVATAISRAEPENPPASAAGCAQGGEATQVQRRPARGAVRAGKAAVYGPRGSSREPEFPERAIGPLAEIEAPEKSQPFGERSRQHLAELCHEKPVEVKPQARSAMGYYVDENAERVPAGGLPRLVSRLKAGRR